MGSLLKQGGRATIPTGTCPERVTSLKPNTLLLLSLLNTPKVTKDGIGAPPPKLSLNSLSVTRYFWVPGAVPAPT